MQKTHNKKDAKKEKENKKGNEKKAYKEEAMTNKKIKCKIIEKIKNSSTKSKYI